MRPVERIKIYINLLKERNLKSSENISEESKFFSPTLTDELYEQIEKVWLENPDWRFTQLCVNTGLIPNTPGMWYYTEDMEFMLNLGFPIREILLWGTYGKTGKDPLKYIQLKNMTNEHIQAIIDTQKQLSNETRQFFIDELNYRKENPESNILET